MQKYDYLKSGVKLFGSHLGGLIVANIFCVILSTIMADKWGNIVSIPLLLVVYSLPVYGSIWTKGNKDRNSENYDRLNKNPYRGFIIGLIENSPFILTGLFFFLSKLGIGYNFVFLYKILNAEILPIMNLFAYGPDSIYLTSYTVSDAFFIALLPLIPVLLDGAYYLLGYFDISPWQRVVYKGKKKEK